MALPSPCERGYPPFYCTRAPVRPSTVLLSVFLPGLSFGGNARGSIQTNPSSVATSSVAPPMTRGRATWRMRLEDGTCASLDDTTTTAEAGLIVRPRCEPIAASVPRRTGSTCIDAATGTKNSIIETGGGMPVPETTASAQGAMVLTASAALGQPTSPLTITAIRPLRLIPSAKVEAATISEMTCVYA